MWYSSVLLISVSEMLQTWRGVKVRKEWRDMVPHPHAILWWSGGSRGLGGKLSSIVQGEGRARPLSHIHFLYLDNLINLLCISSEHLTFVALG